nr:MAG TPA: hypothetical protein [Caudoviricetes sp.]
MTISPFELYVILRLDGISNLLAASGIVLLIFCIILSLAFTMWLVASISYRDNDDIQTLGRVIKKIFSIFLGALFVVVLLQAAIPTTRQMAAILVVPAIVNSEFMQKDLPADLREIYTLAKEGMFKALTDEKGEGEEK